MLLSSATKIKACPDFTVVKGPLPAARRRCTRPHIPSVCGYASGDGWWQTLARAGYRSVHCTFQSKEPRAPGGVALVVEKVPSAYLPSTMLFSSATKIKAVVCVRATLVVACHLSSG